MQLLLFDIDRTLVDTGGCGRAAMTKAFSDIFNRTDRMNEIHFSGRTDRAIFREACERHEIKWSEDALKLFKERYFEVLQDQIQHPNPRQHIEPGVRELLPKLAADGRNVIALLTGNWQQGAYIKLEHFGLGHFFSFGAFADDAENRNDLPAAAAHRFERIYGEKISPDHMVIIGDTPNDVECAKHYGAKSIAVATGGFTIQQLREMNPDSLLSDLSNTDEFLGILARL